MAGSFSVPLHFAVEFLALVVAVGASVDALRARRHGAGPWAIGQALGFGALAAAQTLHGALIRSADGDPLVVALRSIGFVMLALSARPAVHVRARNTVATGTVAMPALFIPGMSADWAIIPAVAAVVVAARGIRAHRVDQDPATFAFAGAFISFAGAELATALAPDAGGVALVIAHGARAAAALFLARWLWTSIIGSVRLRFVASFVVLLTIAVLVVSAALNVVIGNTLEREELERLADAGQARATKLRDLGESGLATVGTFADTAGMRDVLDDRNPAWAGRDGRQQRARSAQVLAEAVLRIAPSNADLIMLVGRQARVLGTAESVRSAEGEQRRPIPRVEAVLLAGTDVVTEALRGRPATSTTTTSALGSEAEVSDQLIVLSASPSLDGRRVVGGVIVGFRVDERFLREIAQDTGAEVSLIVGRELTATTFVDEQQVADDVSALRAEIDTFNRGTFTRVLTVGEDRFPTVFIPVRSADRQLLGFIGLSQRVGAIEAAERDMTRTLFLIALAAVALAAGLAWLSGGRVTRPIRSLTVAARQLQGGNLDARTAVASNDEVGTLGSAFNEMAAELQRTAAGLQDAARTEATLRARIESILQSMGDGLIATDAGGSIVTFNRAAEQMMKTKAERVLGRAIGDVLSGQTRTGRRLSEAALTGRASEGVLHVGQGAIPIAMTSAPLLDAAGETTGRVVVIRDISKEYEAERMKSEFLSNVSHELRTPITPIKGYAEILRRKAFPREKTEEFLDGVLESTERLERIVEILVDFASIEAGRLKPRTEPVPVKGLLDGIADRWRDRNGAHRFIRKGGRGLPPILGDEKLLERSLNELMDNAVKFSPDGGTIEVIASPETNGSRARKPSKIRITIRDHGIGIEPEQMPDLFQDFHQLDGSETRSYGGLGLGLAYVKRIVSEHGGDIQVDSEPGKGSAFSLVLPAADVSTTKGRRPRGRAGARGRASRAGSRTASRSTKRASTRTGRATAASKKTRGKRKAKAPSRKKTTKRKR